MFQLTNSHMYRGFTITKGNYAMIIQMQAWNIFEKLPLVGCSKTFQCLKFECQLMKTLHL